MNPKSFHLTPQRENRIWVMYMHVRPTNGSRKLSMYILSQARMVYCTESIRLFALSNLFCQHRTKNLENRSISPQLTVVPGVATIQEVEIQPSYSNLKYVRHVTVRHVTLYCTSRHKYWVLGKQISRIFYLLLQKSK